ncbi:sensor histidine kinase [Tabrizicola sp.]|uniref:sensor histidine kinase n=1 Tax=Tabrizicola sp. TaxID=2005166 RepID=UPI0035B4C305
MSDGEPDVRQMQGMDRPNDMSGRMEGLPLCLLQASSLVQATGVPMGLVTGPDGLILNNAAWARLTGWQAGDLPEVLREAVQDVLGHPAARLLVLPSDAAPDAAIWPVLDEAGQARGVLILLIPSSEPQDAACAAAIIAGAEDAVLSVDRHLRITSWNGGARRLFGHAAEEVLGHPVTLLSPHPDEDRATFDLILHGKRVATRQTLWLRTDGKRLHVSLAVSPIRDRAGQITGAAVIARDSSASHDLERLQKVLIGEMKHRVKNVLSTVQAIARQTMGSERTEAYVTFEKRILALGRAQDLITRDAHEGVELQAVVASVLAPFPQSQFRFEGPPVRVSSRAAVALALGLHELATNAVKYGALSVKSGCVRIRWAVTPGPPAEFVLRWREEGGPAVAPPKRKGFGTVVIQDVLAAELQGRVQLVHAEDGVTCEVTAPMASVQEQEL